MGRWLLAVLGCGAGGAGWEVGAVSSSGRPMACCMQPALGSGLSVGEVISTFPALLACTPGFQTPAALHCNAMHCDAARAAAGNYGPPPGGFNWDWGSWTGAPVMDDRRLDTYNVPERCVWVCRLRCCPPDAGCPAYRPPPQAVTGRRRGSGGSGARGTPPCATTRGWASTMCRRGTPRPAAAQAAGWRACRCPLQACPCQPPHSTPTPPTPHACSHRVETFVRACQGIANVTRGNDIMVHMGSDFHYANAHATWVARRAAQWAGCCVPAASASRSRTLPRGSSPGTSQQQQ